MKTEFPSAPELKELYPYWRRRIFYSMYIGYAAYYLTRKSYTLALPAIKESLGFDTVSLGMIMTIFSLFYGVSKFANGIIGDRVNPQYFLPIGLILTGLCNLLFGLSSSLWTFALFWGLNGWFQGFGWPSCARLLTHWFSQSERGTWWGKWNTSHNVGGGLVLLLVTFCLKYGGWRMAFYLPGILCIAIGGWLMERLRDTPQSLNLPPIEIFRKDHSEKGQLEESELLSTRQRLGKYVLNNRYIWLLAIASFFLYIARSALNDWSNFYLVDHKLYSKHSANYCVAWFEIGGIFGGLSAGWLSDHLFLGKRGPVNLLYMILTVPLVGLIWLYQMPNPYIDSMLMAAAGFLIFGPQMLIGVAAVELSHKQAAASATGVTGFFAYLGAAFAGGPLGWVIRDYGWNCYHQLLMLCCFCSALALLPLWGAKHYRYDSIR